MDVDVANFAMNGTSSRPVKGYMREVRVHLMSIYGGEVCGLLQEHCVTRKSRLCRCYCRARITLADSLPDKTFTRLLDLKRIIRGLFGLRVS